MKPAMLSARNTFPITTERNVIGEGDIMQNLDDQALSVNDFPRWYRFKMVQAYPVISDVPDVYAATHIELDAGFRRCLENCNLRKTHEMFLADLLGEPGQA